MEKELAFLGLLSNKAAENPGFFSRSLIENRNVLYFAEIFSLLLLQNQCCRLLQLEQSKSPVL